MRLPNTRPQTGLPRFKSGWTASATYVLAPSSVSGSFAFAKAPLGEWRSVGDGVKEIKIAFGPGYRVYFGEDGDTLVVLLFGGDKGSQDADIKTAKKYWADYTR